MIKPKVLIIDDDRGIAKLAEFALHARGYDVQSAFDGRSGMAQACSDPPDLILLDYSLPGKDGIALLEDLRALPDLEDTPVIMITGKGVKDLVQAALRYKICDFLVKPFEVSTLVDRVMKYLPVTEQ